MAVDDRAVRSVDDVPSARSGARARHVPRLVGDPWLWGICVAVLAAYTAMSVSRYVTGNPGSWDLGIFTEAVRHYAHFQAPVVDIRGMDALGDHFSPADALFAPAWWVFPSAVTLLVCQAVLTAGSVIPVYRAAAARLPVTEARLVAGAYGFSWGLASMAWYDVHEVAFAVPLVAGSLSAIVCGKLRASVWWALPLVFVKEDQGATVAAIGIVLAVVYGKRLAGVLLSVWGIGWSLLAVYAFIPKLNPGHTYAYWSQNGHLAGLAAGWDTKSVTLVLLVLPTAFIAPRSPLAAIAIPSVALRFVSSNSVYWGTTWHYNATLMPIAFVAAVDGLSRIRAAGHPEWSKGIGPWLGAHGPAMMATAAAALAMWSPLQYLWQADTYKVPAHTDAAAVAERLIPPGQTVDATLPELAPLAARNDAYYFSDNSAPQWILLDTVSWNIDPMSITRAFPQATYRTVFQRDGVWLEQRIDAR